MANNNEEVEEDSSGSEHDALAVSDTPHYGSVDSNDNKQVNEVAISFKQGLADILIEASPFMLQRGLVVVFNFGNGIVLKLLGEKEVAAGPLITTLQTVLATCPRAGILASAGRTIGQHYGEHIGSYVSTTENIDPDVLLKKIQESKINGSVMQSWLLGTVVGTSAGVILYYSPQLLELLNFHHNQNVSQNNAIAHGYYTLLPTVMGLPASLWACTHQAYAQGVKSIGVSVAIGALPIITAMTVGYPLALATPLGITGLGIGALFFAPWVTAALTTHLLGIYPKFRKYRLFALPNKEFALNSCTMLKYFLSAGAQALSEWGNLFAITLIADSLGNNISIAEQPSLQIVSSATSVITGLSQAMLFIITRADGAIKNALKVNDIEKAELYRVNIKQHIRAGYALTMGGSAIAGIIMAALPNQLISFFIELDSLAPEELEQARQFIFINAIGLFIDAIRNTTIGSLNGLGDIFLPMLVSFTLMNIIGLPISWYLTDVLELDPSWLFIMRYLTIATTIPILLPRLCCKVNKTIPIEEIQANDIEANRKPKKHARNRSCFFKCNDDATKKVNNPSKQAASVPPDKDKTYHRRESLAAYR